MREELMNEIGYYRTLIIYDIETYENKYGDKIMIDLAKNEVTKTSTYYRGWLNEKELDTVSKCLEIK